MNRDAPAGQPSVYRGDHGSRLVVGQPHRRNSCRSRIGSDGQLPTGHGDHRSALPPGGLNDPLERSRITAKFREYVHLCEDELLPKFGALWHWAKLEPPAADDAEGRGRLRRYLRQHYPVDRFNSLRRRWDPKGILASDFIEACFGSA